MRALPWALSSQGNSFELEKRLRLFSILQIYSIRDRSIESEMFLPCNKSYCLICIKSHSMDKRKSFVSFRQYRSCFFRRINALVPRN